MQPAAAKRIFSALTTYKRCCREYLPTMMMAKWHTDAYLLYLFVVWRHSFVSSSQQEPVGAHSPAKPSFLFLLIDDVGWADLGYNDGIAQTPNIDRWARRPGSIIMQDLHSGGTVCSPTRATILTGRNHFRDCVDYVFGCSDMTECVPDFEFAPSRTFTVGDAVRAAGKDYEDGAIFLGKVRLSSAKVIVATIVQRHSFAIPSYHHSTTI